jgi:hypothetical protein
VPAIAGTLFFLPAESGTLPVFTNLACKMANSDNIFQPVLLPTAYFPPAFYFIYLLRYRPVLIEQMETFPKQTYRNRCEIMTVAGKTDLVIPVTKPKGNHTMTGEITICRRQPWARNHWRTLQAAYSSSPFYLYYSETIRELILNEESSLVGYNLNITTAMARMVGINAEIRLTADYIKSPENHLDMRSRISPKKTPPGEPSPFYPQVFGHLHGFLPGLSILDLLFNLGPDTKRYLEGLSGSP